MKFTFLFFILVFQTSICFSQNNSEADIINITKITFINPGISREIRVAKLKSLYMEAFMNTSAFAGWSNTFGFNAGIDLNPAVAAQYRYYYNAGKRAQRGKQVDLNNLNYFAAVFQTDLTRAATVDGHLTETNMRPVYATGLVWGIQRNRQKHFSLDFNIGIGCFFTKGTVYNDDFTYETHSVNVARLTSLGELNLGFWLNQKRKLYKASAFKK